MSCPNDAGIIIAGGACRAAGSSQSGSDCARRNGNGAVWEFAGHRDCGPFGGGKLYCHQTAASNEAVEYCCLGGEDRNYCGTDTCPTSERCKRWKSDVYCNGDTLLTTSVCKDFCRANPSRCMNIMKNACVGSKLKTDECVSWGTKYPELYRQNMTRYCKGDNLNDPFCKEYAKVNSGFDSNVRDFCVDHPTSEFCSCSTAALDQIPDSNEQIKVLKAKPQCYIKECSNEGYKFTSQRANIGGCPQLCMQNISAVGEHNIITGNTTTQNCGGIKIDANDKDPKIPEKTMIDKMFTSPNIWYLLLMLIVIVVTAIVAAYYGGTSPVSDMR
jgi:hypothetical protein